MAESTPDATVTPDPAQDLRGEAQILTDVRERAPELLDILSGGQPPAFASDSRDRVVFWNQGATDLFGKRSDEVLGRRCYEAIGGRDVFGNRFCYANCAVMASVRGGEAVSAFELHVPANGRGACLAQVTILKVPSVRPDLYTLVHVLAPIDAEGRLARALAAVGAVPVSAAPCAPSLEAPATPPLTAREREILQWVAGGLQNKEIAQKLDLSLATVRNHVHNVLEKLEVHSKLEAVSLAFRHGWVRGGNGRPGA
jgi:DNA-binding CsgD family transcriptional regulator